MKKYYLIITLLILSAAFTLAQETKEEDQCFTCHEMLGGKEAELFKKDVHHLKGNFLFCLSRWR
ncbi:MAG: hypothetical protein IPJ03_01495 [Ignavibacteriales bacterium]|nr:hypothetical protein [Ignavibacteriales bacterium]